MWNNNAEFILSCISYGVGLGNLWRFPYLCFKHGGFSFLVPYWTCLVLCGLPLSVLENTLGQYSGHTPGELFQQFPLFKGVGWAMVLIDFGCTFYYMIIVAYAALFFYHSIPTSFPFILPFSHESDFCVDFYENNVTRNLNISCQDYFFKHEILQNSDGFGTDDGFYDGLFSMNWTLLLAFILCWITVFFALKNNTSSAGKVSYVTALLPYTCLFVILCVTLSQEGSLYGIQRYASFDLSVILSLNCWIDAAQQVFFSQGCAFGVLITYSSLNNFNTDIVKVASGISVLNGLTSLFTGFVVYGAIGMLSYEYDNDFPEEHFNQIAENSGQGLAFVVYPTVVSSMGQFSWLMSLIFFAMIITLGIGSQVAMSMVTSESVIGLSRSWKSDNKHDDEGLIGRISEFWWLVIVIAVYILFGLPLCTGSGNQWLSLFNNYCGFITMPLVGFLEFIVVSHVLGGGHFLNEVSSMVKGKVVFSEFWRITWRYTGPFVSLLSVFMCLYGYNVDSFCGVEGCGSFANFIGLLTVAVPVGVVFGCLGHELVGGVAGWMDIEDGFHARKCMEVGKEVKEDSKLISK